MRKGLTFSNVVALLALFTAMGGTAYAAVVITGTNVKDGTLRSADIADGLYGVQSRDVKNASLGAIDLSAAARTSLKGNAGPTGPAGSTGTSGANGMNGGTGPAGARGLSAWDVIPSGTTVTGSFTQDLQTPAAGATGDFEVGLTLPGSAPVALAATAVNFASDGSAASTDDDPLCTGTYAAPTAPAGKVCIYLGVTDPGTFSAAGSNGVGLPRQGFSIYWSDNGLTANTYMYAVWAYTAP